MVIGAVFQFLKKFYRFRKKDKPEFDLVTILEHPLEEDVEPGHIYVVQFNSIKKWAYLRCPCPKKEVIRLCLQKNQNPNWSIDTTSDNYPSINPSIWQTTGCLSHFWVVKGRVVWCEGTGVLKPKYTYQPK